MALITIEPRGEVVSSVLNDNFTYLDDRITTVSSGITTLQSNISSLNSTFTSQINTAKTDVLKIIYPVGSIYIGTMETCPLAALFGTWTLVAKNRVLQGANDDSELGTVREAGTTVAAGLPNITGDFNGNQLHDGSAVGHEAFRTGGSDSKKTPGSGGDSSQKGFNFDASRCSSIYSNDVDTVQPPAYIVNVWERTE